MNRKMRLRFLCACVCCLFVCGVDAQLKVVGYAYTTGNASAVDWSKITHLNLAFENPDASGNLSYGSGNNAYIQKAHENNVKVLVSICGGAASEDVTMRSRYFSLISDANRAGFIEKIVQYLEDHEFDGIDLDLEGPAINSDYDDFVADLDAALPEGMLMTAALSHTNNGNMASSASIQTFDFLNIMAYDQTGPWNPGAPGQHSSYSAATESLAWWVENKGLEKTKAILGVPFYGYGFGADANQGIGYADILSRFGAGAENRDESGNTIYYNGIPTIRKKVKYVEENGFGGIMIWQLGHDLPTSNPKSLLRNIYEEINNITAVETEAKEIFNISPNPTTATINVTLKDTRYHDAWVFITDFAGRRISVNQSTMDAIDVSMLAKGMYLLHLNKGEISFVQKFIRQ